MATPRTDEEFKRGEGVPDVSLGDSKEWTGSRGCKATPRGIWRGLLELHIEKQRNTDRTQSSVSSASMMTEILWVVCLWSVAQRDKKKKEKSSEPASKSSASAEQYSPCLLLSHRLAWRQRSFWISWLSNAVKH